MPCAQLPERNENYKSITTKLIEEDALFDLSSGVCIWMGDLNYRLAGDNAKVRQLVKQNKLRELDHLDQLAQVRDGDIAFGGWSESEITFKPTYKFDVNTDIYDTSFKQRVPSWTDRVLYRAAKPCAVHPHPKSYKSHPGIKLSDHKPVSAAFSLQLA